MPQQSKCLLRQNITVAIVSMPAPYSVDLRPKALETGDRGEPKEPKSPITTLELQATHGGETAKIELFVPHQSCYHSP